MEDADADIRDWPLSDLEFLAIRILPKFELRFLEG